MSVREPKDVVASMIEVGRKHRKTHTDSPVARYADSVVDLCDLVNRFYASTLVAVDDGEFGDRLLFVRYEDVVLHTRSEATRVAAFAKLTLDGFDPDAAWSEGYERAVRLEDPRTAAFVTELTGKGFRASRIGRWKETLTGDQAALVDDRCAVLRQRFGYSW